MMPLWLGLKMPSEWFVLHKQEIFRLQECLTVRLIVIWLPPLVLSAVVYLVILLFRRVPALVRDLIKLTLA